MHRSKIISHLVELSNDVDNLDFLRRPKAWSCMGDNHLDFSRTFPDTKHRINDTFDLKKREVRELGGHDRSCKGKCLRPRSKSYITFISSTVDGMAIAISADKSSPKSCIL